MFLKFCIVPVWHIIIFMMEKNPEVQKVTLCIIVLSWEHTVCPKQYGGWQSEILYNLVTAGLFSYHSFSHSAVTKHEASWKICDSRFSLATVTAICLHNAMSVFQLTTFQQNAPAMSCSLNCPLCLYSAVVLSMQLGTRQTKFPSNSGSFGAYFGTVLMQYGSFKTLPCCWYLPS